ncbi:MAG: hypothetical protein QG657_1753 [Acidobacteriota bacterium]|nr:hypothetical protein [Acidobacteriota bacterium]
MNKIKIVAVILIVITTLVHAERLAVLKENFSTPFMVFDKEYIYIGDKVTLSINIYSRKDLSFIKTFGGKGEGPAQFMWIHSIQVDRDFVYVSGSAKFSIFSKPGKLKKEIRLNPNSGKYMKLGPNFVSESFSDPETSSEYYEKINLLGENGKKIKEIYSTPITPIRTYNTPKQDFLLVSDFVEYAVNNQELYLGNTIKGFYFIVFNENGDKVSEINLPYEKRPIKADEKEEYISRFAHWHGEAIKKRFNFLFPEFFPAFETFSIADDRIYVFLHNPHPMTIKEQQTVILDLQGKLLKQIAAPLPLDAAFTISDGKFYYLTDNEDTEMWELHAIKIDI